MFLGIGSSSFSVKHGIPFPACLTSHQMSHSFAQCVAINLVSSFVTMLGFRKDLLPISDDADATNKVPEHMIKGSSHGERVLLVVQTDSKVSKHVKFM